MTKSNYTEKLPVQKRTLNSLEKEAKKRKVSIDDLANEILNNYFSK